MGLAILALHKTLPDHYLFTIDTGSSGWWELVIGRGVSSGNGPSVVDDVADRTPLKPSPPNGLQTARVIRLNRRLFDRKKRYLQLFAYTSEDKRGPVFSKVIELIPHLQDKGTEDANLPVIEMPKTFSTMSSEYMKVNKVPFQFQATPLSGQMGWAALMPLLTNLLPLAGSLLGGLFKKGGEQGAASSGSAPATGGVDLKALLTPENIKAVTDLIASLQQKNNLSSGKSLDGSVSPVLLTLSAQLQPVLAHILTPEAIRAIGGQPEKLYAAIGDWLTQLPETKLLELKRQLSLQTPLAATLKHPPAPYSEAKIAPALLAAIPVLMPLVEKLMDSQKDNQKHIEAMMPKGVNMDDVIKQIMGSVNTYNMVSHLPQPVPAPSAAQSILVNSLWQCIPAIEKSLENNGLDEIRENTEDLTKKVRNELIQIQEVLKEHFRKLLPTGTVDKLDGKSSVAASLSYASTDRARSGNRIFGHERSNDLHGRSKALLEATLPMAISHAMEQYRYAKIAARTSKSTDTTASPQSTDPSTELLLEKIEQSRSLRPGPPEGRPGTDYALQIVGTHTIPIDGTPKVVYVREKGIGFALRVLAVRKDAPALDKAIIQVECRNGTDDRIVLSKKFYFKHVDPANFEEILRLEPGEIVDLPANQDLLVHFTLAWKTDQQHTRTTRKTHSILITDGFLFGSWGNALKQGIPLNDVHKHRAFWHRVWQSNPQSQRGQVRMLARYYMQCDPGATNNALAETRMAEWTRDHRSPEDMEDERWIKLKSGMRISLQALNQILPTVSSEPSLTPAQMETLTNPECKKQFDLLAEATLRFRFKESESASLWIFPEFDLVRLNLLAPKMINALGNVLDTVVEERAFLRPRSIHFVGTKNAST